MDDDAVRQLLELERAREARRRRRNKVLAWTLPGVLVVGLAGWFIADRQAEEAHQRCVTGQMYADQLGLEPRDC